MTAAQWRTVALFCVLAVGITLAVSLIKNSVNERRSKAAAITLDSVTMQLDTVRAVLDESRSAASIYQRERDSVMALKPDTVWRVRQYTPVVIDTGDVASVAAGIVAIAAERDTAIIDRDAARDSVRVALVVIAGLDSLARAHAADDSSRFARIESAADTAETQVHTARALVRPRWYRRLGGALVRGGKVAGVAAVAFLIGRST